MKTKLITAASSFLLAANTFAQTPVAPATTPPVQPELPTNPQEIKDLSSYGFGYQSGIRFEQEMSSYGIGIADIDKEKFANAFWEAFKGSEPSVAQEKIGPAMQALAQNIQKREQKLGAANLEAGKKFLAENAKRDGVTVTPSGLQYEVLKAGEGKLYTAPTDGSQDQGTRFMVSYKGTLIDGTEFDASEQPVAFTLRIVPGFREALTSMKVGSQWKIFLPASLGYGEQRQGPLIEPNSTLVFEVALHEILPPEPKPTIPANLQDLIQGGAGGAVAPTPKQ